MVITVGAMLKAAELGMVILIDGFIMTNCILAASRLYPEVMSYAKYSVIRETRADISYYWIISEHVPYSISD